MDGSLLTTPGLTRAVADVLGVAAGDVDPHQDLLRQGLDSVRIMRLAAVLRGAGVTVSFAELIEQPTIAAWCALVGGPADPPVPAGAGDPVPAGEPAVAEGDPFPLSPMQHAYWIGRLPGQVLGVGAHFYNEFDGIGVDPARLGRAVRALVVRHPMLRARFLDDGRQVIDPPGGWRGVTVSDLRDCDPEEIEVALAERRGRLSHRRLAVDRGEVFDVQLSLLPSGRCRTHLNIDMLVADAHSFRILLSDLAALYRDPDRALPPIRYSFARYLAERGDRERRERASCFWRQRLAELPGPPQLPLGTAPERVQQPRITRRSHRLSGGEWARLADRAAANGVTLAMVFVAAFAEVLGCWAERPRFRLNLPLYDRQPLHPDVGHLVGDFTNLLLLPVDVSDEVPFAERVKRIQAEFHTCASYAEYSGLDVLRDLAREHPDRPTTAPVVFTSALGLGELFDAEVRAVFGEPGWTSSQTPQVWLDQQVTEREGGLHLNWDAVDGLLAEGVLDGICDGYQRLLAWLGAPGTDWSRPGPSLLPASQRQARDRVNATAGRRDQRGLHELVFSRAAAEPERAALVWGERDRVSYGELAGTALRIAGALRAAGVRPGEPVAVQLPKGAGQVEAVLGVLAAGGVYVPVGVDQPAARRDRILRSAGARLVLADPAPGEGSPGGPPGGGCRTLPIADACRGPALAAPAEVWCEAPAYIIYTSGSTGEPKGVVVPHRAAVNTIEAINDRFGVGRRDRVLAVSALDFDLSVYDIFGLLSAGGSVALIGEQERRDAASWVELVDRWQVTLWQSVPFLLDMLLTAASAEPGGSRPLGGSLRLALLGGDWVPLDLAGRLRRLCPAARLVALGGTTETAIHSTVQEVSEVPTGWRSVPYGVPLRNQACRVVDRRGRDRPDWVPGELWIGGDSVALEYRGDLDRSARQFVQYGGRRWYRTGDLARYWPDGTLEFLGRTDHQVKIRGHRIELGELESALLEHPAVSQAVLTAIGQPTTRLVAVVAAAGTDPAGLRDFLADRLPPAMLPERILVRDQLPLSGNGKIDRRAVRAIAAAAGEPAGLPDGGGEPPAGPVEAAAARVWAELLGRDRISRADSFFALGGDSLLATRMVARLRAEGVTGAEVGRLFAAPVLGDFASGLTLRAATQPASATPALAADHEHRYHPFPTTEAQRAYWLGRSDEFALGGVGTTWYLEFDGVDVDLARLEEAFNRLISRHEMLRAVLGPDGRQRILRDVPRFPIRVVAPEPDREQAELSRMREELSRRRFDPERWPLFDVRAVRHGGGRTRLGVTLDYLVLDALSIMIVYSEWGRLYRDLDAALPPLPLSFRDYLLGVRPAPATVAAAWDYWRSRLDELPPAPRLPLRTDPALVRGARFTRREAALPAAQWAAIQARARRHGLTGSTVLATAYAEVLSAWEGQSGIRLMLTLFDRADVHPDIATVVGDFTSLLLVDVDLGAEEGFMATARRLQERVGAAMEHRAVSAVAVLRELARRGGDPQLGAPVVFTSALGLAGEAADLDLPFGERVWGLSQTPQVLLDHQVSERAGEPLLTWDAAEDLFAPGVLDAMFDAYLRLLHRLADEDWADPVPALLPARQRAVRASVNATDGPYPDRPVHQPFFTLAVAHPDRDALRWGDRGRMSYRELADAALRVAASLRARGVGPGDPVAVSLPRGPDQIVAVLGVLAAGGAYVPVGIGQPEPRRARIYAGAGVRAVLAGTPGEFAPAGDLPVLAMAEARSTPPLPAPVPVGSDQLAYVIYTSGSTGEPKGVEITHRGVVNTIEDVNDRFGVGPEDRVLAVSALDFDLSAYDIFGLLSVGGALVLVDQDAPRDPARWTELAHSHGVSVWNSVPALLDMFLLTAGGRGFPPTLRLALVSGDWVGIDLPGRLAGQSDGRCRLVALGGATEAAIWSNAYPVEQLPGHATSIPYGFPLRNQRYRVVDPRGRDCPDWVPGELWIGGAGVAAGYRGDPERTAQRFLTYQGIRWYRTGDLGRYWPDGTLEFLGRVDDQVKIHGHRIELGEVEAALESHPAVGRAVVVAVGERARRLVAAAVPVAPEAAGRPPPGEVELREHLATRLPEYMLPARVAVLDQLPLSANGKVDRVAVAAQLGSLPARAGELPVGPVETALGQLWSELLEADRVGRDEHFFTLGGDSLLATRLVERIRGRFGVELSLRQIFTAPTVTDQARLICAELPGQTTGDSTDLEEGVL